VDLYVYSLGENSVELVETLHYKLVETLHCKLVETLHYKLVETLHYKLVETLHYKLVETLHCKPMWLMQFFIDLILSTPLWSWVPLSVQHE